MKTEHIKATFEERDLISVFMLGEPGIYSTFVTWSDLMPVVEKIENGLKWKYSVDTTNELYAVNEIVYYTTIYDAGHATKLDMPQESTRLKSVYKAVIEFIKFIAPQHLKK